MNKSLEKFLKLNPILEIVEETEHINLNKLWADETFMCRYKKDTDFSCFENIELPVDLIAIFHKKEQALEFIFSPLQESFEFLNRKTVFLYKGVELRTDFSEPSEALKTLAQGFKKLDTPTDSQYRNLPVFNDFYNEEQNVSMKTFFKDKKPYSFYVRGNFDEIKNDFVPLCKHLNIYLRYFDRKAPTIAIVNTDPKAEEFKIPCYSDINKFPTTIIANDLDPIAMDLFQVAHESGNPRLKYLFYYQVLEYFAYYYLDEEIKRKLSNILRTPDLIYNSHIHARTLIEELKDYSNSNTDKQKLSKLILDYVTVEDLLLELKCNLKNFTTDIEFDGGFKLSPIINDEKMFDKILMDTKEKRKEKEKIKSDLISTIVDRIDKIRNVLVHIRESMENKVILPSRANSHNLTPYIYLIRRIAEVVAMKYKI